jgi:hypothetical protein
MMYTHLWLTSARKRCAPHTLRQERLTERGIWQDFDAARKKALAIGAKKFFLEVWIRAFLISMS